MPPLHVSVCKRVIKSVVNTNLPSSACPFPSVVLAPDQCTATLLCRCRTRIAIWSCRRCKPQTPACARAMKYRLRRTVPRPKHGPHQLSHSHEERPLALCETSEIGRLTSLTLCTCRQEFPAGVAASARMLHFAGATIRRTTKKSAAHTSSCCLAGFLGSRCLPNSVRRQGCYLSTLSLIHI